MTKKLDILLVSMPRSGSTLLANLMTYGNSWCMVEPHSHENRTKSWITRQASALGRSMKHCDFENLPKQMKDFERWGIKEIHKRHYIPINEQLNPKHYIILLRDPAEIFLSLRNFHYTQKDLHQKLYDTILGWWNDIYEFAALIPNKTVVYYDQLLDPEYRKQLGHHLNWPLSGQPDKWLQHYGRESEARGNVIRKRTHLPTNTDLKFMEQIRVECKKDLFATLLIKQSSVIVVEDLLQGDPND